MMPLKLKSTRHLPTAHFAQAESTEETRQASPPAVVQAGVPTPGPSLGAPHGRVSQASLLLDTPLPEPQCPRKKEAFSIQDGNWGKPEGRQKSGAHHQPGLDWE